MPTISMFRGIKIFINWDDHNKPHIHATYGDDEVCIEIMSMDVTEGSIPKKQLNMVLGWIALHQEELMENWNLAQSHHELFQIEPLK